MTPAEQISRFARVDHALAELVVTAANAGGHSLKALRGSSNARKLVLARRWVVKKARPRFGFSEIGRALNRDHSTIIYHERLIHLGVDPVAGLRPRGQTEQQFELLQ